MKRVIFKNKRILFDRRFFKRRKFEYTAYCPERRVRKTDRRIYFRREYS